MFIRKRARRLGAVPRSALLPTITTVLMSLAAYMGCQPEKEIIDHVNQLPLGSQLVHQYQQYYALTHPNFNQQGGQSVSYPTGGYVQSYPQANYPNGPYTASYPNVGNGYAAATHSQPNSGGVNYPTAYGYQTSNPYPNQTPSGTYAGGYDSNYNGGQTYTNPYPQNANQQSTYQTQYGNGSNASFAGYVNSASQSLQGLESYFRNPSNRITTGQIPQRSAQTILVGSFNIQAFGTTKMNDRWVMERLGEIIRHFDVIAIQEIRSKDQRILDVLKSYINASGGRYDYTIGTRLGRTDSKEQYAFIYDASRIATTPESSYQFNDRDDLLHREPLIGRFVVRTNLTAKPWTFSLADIHTDPDEVTAEVEALGPIMKTIRNWEYSAANEDDCILLGDLNADPKKLQPITVAAGLQPTILDQATNTLGTKAYDNIMIDPSANTEYTGRSGVLNMQQLLSINADDAVRLSDHNPVWAEFLVEERGNSVNGYYNQQIANQPGYYTR